jgi:DNA-binding beta-propeller fold protein YncE
MPMRRFALLLALLAVPARADLLYVLNSGEATILVLDAHTREEVRRIGVLREAHHLVLSPDRRTLLIGDSGGNEMLFLAPLTGETLRRERLGNPYHLDFTPDGTRLVVTSLRRGQVDIYGWAADTLTLQHRLRPGDKPSHLAFRPDGRFVYVTLQGSRAIAAIEVATGTLAWTLEVGREPAGILWHGERLLVGIMGSDHVAVVDPLARLVERTIPVGRGAHTIFAAPNGAALYVTSRVDSRITALDPGTLRVVQQWETPGGPDDITFDRQGRLWTTLRWAGRVGVLDPETGALDSFRVGRSPHGILYQRRP